MTKRDKARRLLTMTPGSKGVAPFWHDGEPSPFCSVDNVLDALAPLLDRPAPDGHFDREEPQCAVCGQRPLYLNASGAWLCATGVCPGQTASTVDHPWSRPRMTDEPAPDGEWLDEAQKLLSEAYNDDEYGGPTFIHASGDDVVDTLAPLARRDAEQRAEIERLTAEFMEGLDTRATQHVVNIDHAGIVHPETSPPVEKADD